MKAKRFYITDQEGNYYNGKGFNLVGHWSVSSARMYTKIQAEKQLKNSIKFILAVLSIKLTN